MAPTSPGLATPAMTRKSSQPLPGQGGQASHVPSTQGPPVLHPHPHERPQSQGSQRHAPGPLNTHHTHSPASSPASSPAGSGGSDEDAPGGGYPSSTHHFHHPHASVSSSPAYTPSQSAPQSSLQSPAHHGGHLAMHHPPSIAALHDGITSIREEKEEDMSSGDSGERALSPGSSASPYHPHHSSSLTHASHGHQTHAQQSPPQSVSHLPPLAYSPSDADAPTTAASHAASPEELHDALYAKYRQWSVAALKEHIKALASTHPRLVDSDEVQATLRSAMEKKDLIELLIRLTPAAPTPQTAHLPPQPHSHSHEGPGRGAHEAKHGWVEEGAGGVGGSKLFTFSTGHPGNGATLQAMAASSPTPSQSSPSGPQAIAQSNRFTMVSPASQSQSEEHSPPLDSPVLGRFRRHHSLEVGGPQGVTYSASADDLSKLARGGVRGAEAGAGVAGHAAGGDGFHHQHGADELKALEAFDPLYEVGQKTGAGDVRAMGGSRGGSG